MYKNNLFCRRWDFCLTETFFSSLPQHTDPLLHLQETAKGVIFAAVVYVGSAIMRFRLSSVCALLVAGMPDISAGSELQDLIVLLGTMDLVLGELDR